MADDAFWYPETRGYLRLEHRVYGEEWKNLTEKTNRAVKDRLERFDDLFPCPKEECDHEHVRIWSASSVSSTAA